RVRASWRGSRLSGFAVTGHGAERRDGNVPRVAPAHEDVHFPLPPLHRASVDVQIRRHDLFDLALPREWALGAGVAAGLGGRGDLAGLEIGEQHRLLMLARELEQP